MRSYKLLVSWFQTMISCTLGFHRHASVTVKKKGTQDLNLYQGTSVVLLQVCCYSLDAGKIRERNKYCRLSIPEPPWTHSGGEKEESQTEKREDQGIKTYDKSVLYVCISLYSCPTNRFIGTTDSTYMH